MRATSVVKKESYWGGVARAGAVGILLLAAALRLWGLGAQSIWQDEAYSVVLAREHVGTIIQRQVEDSSPPLYYVLLHFWIVIFGDSEFAARLPSALCGIGLVAATLLIASRLFGPKVGLGAGAMLAIAPLAVCYSQEARMYSLTPLLAVISVYLCHLLGENVSKRRIAWFIGTTVAMLYTQNYGVFVLVAEGLYLLANRKRRRDPRPMLALMGVVGAYVPWLLVLSKQVAENTTPWIPQPRARMLFETLLHLSFKSWRLPSTFFLKVIWAVGLAAVAGLIIMVICVLARARRSDSEAWGTGAGLLFLSYTIVPIFCAYIASQSKPIYVPGRYDTIVQPGLFILVALGLTSIRVDWLRNAIGCVLVVVLLLSLHAYFTVYYKSNDREIAGYIAHNARETDVVLFTDLTITPFRYYYPDSKIATLRFPQGGFGWTPKGAFTNDLAFFEQEFDTVKRRLSALWPQKSRLLVVFKPSPALYCQLLARLRTEQWLRLEARVPFRMGHNVENQAEAVFVFGVVEAPSVYRPTTNDAAETEMR
ncbi:MAG TPA: glycosyltransferase family 39 protein [bacterium]|nr:glycosyltransferase family 39 protein [bacterium]